jgi:hypothetical protein
MRLAPLAAKLAPSIMQMIFPFSDLAAADLVVDAVYEGGRKGNAGDDPFPRLLGLSNQGGFRYRGTMGALGLVALTSSMNDPDWPDGVDTETGVLTYYGDNKHPGRELHATPRHGNEILRDLFAAVHRGRDGRASAPPVLAFANTGTWRDVRFVGLAVPGSPDFQIAEDLVAIWRTASGQRFQNYRARLTILDTPVVPRAWLDDVLEGNPHTSNAPRSWAQWIRTGRPRALRARRTVEFRRRVEQEPGEPEGRAMLRAIHAFFDARPHDFEACAGALARMMLPDIVSLELTRPSRDGGRDAIGQLRIGSGSSSILVDFALEAKCYASGSPVGVRDASRLISRLRHRQFGIMVTTSFLHDQAYREIKEDGHPIIVIAGVDIVAILKAHGLGTVDSVTHWLQQTFSPHTSEGVAETA